MTSVAVEYYRLRIILFSNRIHFDLSQQTEKRSQIVYNKIKFLRSRYICWNQTAFCTTHQQNLEALPQTNERTSPPIMFIDKSAKARERLTYLRGLIWRQKHSGPAKPRLPESLWYGPGWGRGGAAPTAAPRQSVFGNPNRGANF